MPSVSSRHARAAAACRQTEATTRQARQIVTRPDDNEDTIRKRLDIWRREAQPLEDYFRANDLIVDFEITGGIPETLPKILEVLDENKNARGIMAAERT